MKPAVFSLLFLLVLLSYVESARILVVFPMTGRSLYSLGNALAKALVEAGHDITMVAPIREKNPPKNGGKWTEVYLDGFMDEREKNSNFNFFDLEDMHPLFNLPFTNWIGNEITEKTLSHPAVQNLLKSNEKFDLVILAQFTNDAMKAFAHHYNAPLVLLSTLGANAWVNRIAANPAPPSYISDLFLSYSSHMTFYERFKNTLFGIISDLNHHLVYIPSQNKIMKKHFPNAPDLQELYYNVTSLILLNSHVSTNPPKPLVPAMVEIGGFHLNPTPTKLPKDLQEFLDNAKDGVIYFSMGSNLKSSTMPEEKREAILKALAKLKQQVLWKWEEDNLPGQPPNVKLAKWLPQQDILAHPNVKIFITHGGLLSTTETIYHGKPVLQIPIFGDQKTNALQAELGGFGLTIHFKDLTESRITTALNELLTNPKYSENAKRRSIIMKDRPQKPKDVAVWWVEYVLRHKGAPHLRVSGVELSWYQYLVLDVFALLTVIVLGVVGVFYIICRRICCRRKKIEKIKKN